MKIQVKNKKYFKMLLLNLWVKYLKIKNIIQPNVTKSTLKL